MAVFLILVFSRAVQYYAMDKYRYRYADGYGDLHITRARKNIKKLRQVNDNVKLLLLLISIITNSSVHVINVEI